MTIKPPADDAGNTLFSAADRDRQLIARFRRGDEPAFDELFRLYLQPVQDYLQRRTGDAQNAEDAAQVAFIHAYDALRRDDRDIHFQGWIRSIARNALADVWRWSQRQKRPEEADLEEDDLPERILADVLGAANLPRQSAERQETVERFWLVASALPRGQYHVLLLRLKYGRSSGEAAAILGKEPAAVDVLFREAKLGLPEAGYAALAKEAPNLVPCVQLRALVVTFPPGLLTGEERRRINHHVRDCPVCLEHRQGLRWMDLFAPRRPGGDLFLLAGAPARSRRTESPARPSRLDQRHLPGSVSQRQGRLPLPSSPAPVPSSTWTAVRVGSSARRPSA